MKMGKIFSANLKMIYRDKISLFWALVFPLLFIALFGLFSQGMSSETLGKLAFIDQVGDASSAQFREVDRGLGHLRGHRRELGRGRSQEGAAQQRPSLSRWWSRPRRPARPTGEAPRVRPDNRRQEPEHQRAAVSFFEGLKQQYIIQGIKAQIDYVLQQPIPDEAKAFYTNLNDQLSKVSEPIQQEQSGKNPVKYFDMIFIGLLCMGVMNYAITGFAINLASLREQKILKRLLTTPLPISRFMSSEILAFIVLAFVQVGVMLAVGVGLFGAHIYESWWFLFALSFLGAVLFLAIGFLVAAFAKTGQAASGMANSIAIPLMFLSGVFFPLEALPDFFYQIFRFLPLSPMIQAMRAVCLEGDPVGDQLSRILIMVAWLVVIMAVALKSFKFGDE